MPLPVLPVKEGWWVGYLIFYLRTNKNYFHAFAMIISALKYKSSVEHWTHTHKLMVPG